MRGGGGEGRTAATQLYTSRWLRRAAANRAAAAHLFRGGGAGKKTAATRAQIYTSRWLLAFLVLHRAGGGGGRAALHRTPFIRRSAPFANLLLNLFGGGEIASSAQFMPKVPAAPFMWKMWRIFRYRQNALTIRAELANAAAGLWVILADVPSACLHAHVSEPREQAPTTA